MRVDGYVCEIGSCREFHGERVDGFEVERESVDVAKFIVRVNGFVRESVDIGNFIHVVRVEH